MEISQYLLRKGGWKCLEHIFLDSKYGFTGTYRDITNAAGEIFGLVKWMMTVIQRGLVKQF